MHTRHMSLRLELAISLLAIAALLVELHIAVPLT